MTDTAEGRRLLIALALLLVLAIATLLSPVYTPDSGDDCAKAVAYWERYKAEEVDVASPHPFHEQHASELGSLVLHDPPKLFEPIHAFMKMLIVVQLMT